MYRYPRVERAGHHHRPDPERHQPVGEDPDGPGAGAQEQRQQAAPSHHGVKVGALPSVYLFHQGKVIELCNVYPHSISLVICSLFRTICDTENVAEKIIYNMNPKQLIEVACRAFHQGNLQPEAKNMSVSCFVLKLRATFTTKKTPNCDLSKKTSITSGSFNFRYRLV